MIPDDLETRFYVCASWARQIWGICIGRRYGPRHPRVYSERHGRNVRVLLSIGGWRIRLRTDRAINAAMDAEGEG